MTDQLQTGASQARMDPADILTRLGRHWGWALAFGVLTVAVGIVALVWPGRTLLVIAVLFGIQLIVTGIFRFVSAFASTDLSGGTRVLYAVLGLLSLVIGLYAVRHILLTLLALLLVLGIFWVVNGVVELFSALSHRQMEHRGWTGLMGVFSIFAGIVVLVFPGLSIFALDIVVSVWLVVFGIMEIGLGLRARSASHAVHAT